MWAFPYMDYAASYNEPFIRPWGKRIVIHRGKALRFDRRHINLKADSPARVCRHTDTHIYETLS